MVYDFEFLPSFDPSAYATIDYVDAQDNLHFKKTGGTITGSFSINRGEKPHPQFKITPNAGTTNFATNIYSLGDGDMRFRTSHTESEENHVGSHIVLRANGGNPETKIYNVVEAGESTAVPRSYVDEAVANIDSGGGVPVGSIMIWINSDVPDGWFKLHGASFDINTYPLLHAYLQGTNNYTSGKLPDWSGHYPGEYGDHLSASHPALGKKVSQQTAQPSGGAPRVQQVFPTVTLGHLTQRVEPMLTQTVKEKSQLTRAGTTSPDQKPLSFTTLSNTINYGLLRTYYRNCSTQHYAVFSLHPCLS